MARYFKIYLLVVLSLILIANELLPQGRADSTSTKKGRPHCLKDDRLTQCKGAKYSPQNGGCVCAFGGICGEEI
jgi:hypothetical protein